MGIPHYITDTQCGFKIYRGDVAKELYGESFCDWFMYDIEMILRAVRKKYMIVEFPVRWSNDADTRFHPLKGGAKRDLEELAVIRFTMLRWRKPPALVPVTPVDVDAIAQTAQAEVPAST
jgi:hypothetical protein